MKEDIFKNNQEKFIPKIELATENDWEECKRLRVLEVSGEDAQMFGLSPEEIEKEKNTTKEDWQNEIKNEDTFFVLSKDGSKAVGFGRAIREKEGQWRMGWGYTEKDFRNKGFGTKNSMFRLKELLKRNATQAKLFVMGDNPASLHVQESLGFKLAGIGPSVKKGQSDLIHMMTLDLTDPEVIKKINDFVI